MTTTRDDIRAWLSEGKRKGATHVIILCDTFDYCDYPVYVMPGQNAREVADAQCKNGAMTRVMECYSLALPIEAQLNEFRASHWE